MSRDHRGALAILIELEDDRDPLSSPCPPPIASVPSCRSKFPDDFKWSITVDRHQFEYWEARGTPSRIHRIAPHRFVIDFDFVGEGNAWKERLTFTLADKGRTLIVDKAYPEL